METKNPDCVSPSGIKLETSPIGFGTSGIMGSALTDYGRLKLLQCALDQGITHFDTAPLYGMGEAETLIGKFIKNQRQEVTVATKYGRNPPRISMIYRLAAPLARAAYHRSRGLKKIIESTVRRENKNDPAAPRLAPTTPVAGTRPNNSSYEREDMERSLHKSLQKLRTDYIDFYLLHECSSGSITEEVIETLEGFVNQGKIKAYGLATGRTASKEILSNFPGFRGAVQIPLTVLNPDLANIHMANNLLTITHSALNHVVGKLQNILADQARLDEWCQIVSYDLLQPGAIPRFLLAHARLANPDGIVLFSSQKKDHLIKNAQYLRDSGLSPQQLNAFTNLVGQELVYK